MARELDSQYDGMIREDHNEVANLPREVVMKKYPRNRFLDSYYLDDTIRGIDDVNHENERKIERHHSDSMY